MGVMWDKTKEEFGYGAPPEPTHKSRKLSLWVQCDQCKAESIIQWGAFLRRNASIYTCRKCVGNSAAVKEKLSAIGRIQWRDPKYRERVATAINTPAVREKLAKIHDNPEHQKKVSAAIKSVWSSTGYREKMSKIWTSSEYRSKLADISKSQWEDPEYKARMVAAKNDPTMTEKVALTSKILWKSHGFVKVPTLEKHKFIRRLDTK